MAEQQLRRCGYLEWSTRHSHLHWATWKLFVDVMLLCFCQLLMPTQPQEQISIEMIGQPTAGFKLFQMWQVMEWVITQSILLALPRGCTPRMWRVISQGSRQNSRGCGGAMQTSSQAIQMNSCGGRDMARQLEMPWKTLYVI